MSALALAAPGVACAQDVGDRIVVQRAANLSAAQNADVRADAGVTLVSSLPIADVQVVAADDGDRDRALAALRSDPRVQWAEADAMRYAAGVSDPLFSLQWAMSNSGQVVNTRAGTAGADISAVAAWGFSRGAGITVAVVDSGAQLDHPDLQLVPGHDYVANDEIPSDGSGHGTQVSGVVAAANNAIGVTGTAPDAKVMPLKVLDSNGAGRASNSAAAMAHAGDLGLKVVNASYSWTVPSNVEEAAIRDHPDTLYVVAAGNSSGNVDVDATAVYPCAYTDANVLCVGASDQNDARAMVNPANPAGSLSNYGPTRVDLFAPGVSIATTSIQSKYVFVSGTSMAAPLVSAAAAMLFSYDPRLTVQQVKQALIASADHPAALSGLSVSGGRLNVAAALRAVGATDPAPPAAEPADPAPEDDPADDAGDGSDDTFDDANPSADTSGQTPTLSAVSLDGPVVVCARKCRAKPAALKFKLSAGARVVVSLAHRSCPHVHDCKYGWAAKRTVRGRAGVQRLTVARTVAGMRLRAGRWRLTLAVAHSRRSVHFTVRRGR